MLGENEVHFPLRGLFTTVQTLDTFIYNRIDPFLSSSQLVEILVAGCTELVYNSYPFMAAQ